MKKSKNKNAQIFSLPSEFPPDPKFQSDIRRAPNRGYNLTQNQTLTALNNALRYIPSELHNRLAPEFLEELISRGRIYGYRYRPEGNLKAKPIHEYRGNTLEGKAFQVMIDNNLDFDVALYPYELVTYGESGQVFQNWMQYRLVKRYLEEIRDDQTLVIYSGHPLGLFTTSEKSPRVISTNGLMIGIFDNPEGFHTAAALGVANYGQMTAGGWMYIGPQGIVHGTYITLLNAARIYLGVPNDKDLRGIVFLSSGLGGMSGAQAKAVEIAGGIGVIAEVDESRIETRYRQGWVTKVSKDLNTISKWISDYRKRKEPISIAYHGNVVDLWEFMAQNNIPIELASDQTSCHDVYGGGYTPAGISFSEGRQLLAKHPERFRRLVDQSLLRQIQLIQQMSQRGTHFWDYGNSFLKAVYDAGARNITRNVNDTLDGFIFPSYVEHIMGPLCFDFGYGPFRWVCLSGNPDDLHRTDLAAMSCIDPNRRGMDRDNYEWIRNADKNQLVVGTQARILYADTKGRIAIALKFNEMIRKKEIGPIMLGRDHHDVSGTDSPYRETANIKDGSNVMAEMAIHNFCGDAIRGMSLSVLSNGGGVGIGKSVNGGFGLVLDGSAKKDKIIRSAIEWDVMNGLARRSWARNPNAIEVVNEWNSNQTKSNHITVPKPINTEMILSLVTERLAIKKKK